MNKPTLTSDPSDDELHAFGYAPGNYMSKCLDCEAVIWHVDKRCHVCRPCAVKRFQKPRETVTSKECSHSELRRGTEEDASVWYCVEPNCSFELTAVHLKPSGDSTEQYYAEMEAARNTCLDAYFIARPQLLRTHADESIFRAGFERAFSLLWNRPHGNETSDVEWLRKKLRTARNIIVDAQNFIHPTIVWRDVEAMQRAIDKFLGAFKEGEVNMGNDTRVNAGTSPHCPDCGVQEEIDGAWHKPGCPTLKAVAPQGVCQFNEQTGGCHWVGCQNEDPGSPTGCPLPWPKAVPSPGAPPGCGYPECGCPEITQCKAKAEASPPHLDTCNLKYGGTRCTCGLSQSEEQQL